MVLLDVFFASSWSRKAYPHLNKISPKSHPVSFAICLLWVFTFWPLVVYDRIVLGKHTLNQVLLGSQTGIWCAFFSHFVLRDFIFSHVRRISSAGSNLTKAEAYKYCLGATMIATSVFVSTYFIGLVSSKTNILQQQWLINQRDTCGQKYEVDAEGNLLVNANGMYNGTVVKLASVFGLLGLFIGQVLFRNLGYGRLESDAYTSKQGLIHQAVFAGLIYVIYMTPEWLQVMFSDDMNYLVKAIFVVAIPQFIACFILNYVVPVLTSKLLKYPEALVEFATPEPTMSSLDDLEIQKSTKSVAIPKSVSCNTLLGK